MRTGGRQDTHRVAGVALGLHHGKDTQVHGRMARPLTAPGLPRRGRVKATCWAHRLVSTSLLVHREVCGAQGAGSLLKCGARGAFPQTGRLNRSPKEHLRQGATFLFPLGNTIPPSSNHLFVFLNSVSGNVTFLRRNASQCAAQTLTTAVFLPAHRPSTGSDTDVT